MARKQTKKKVMTGLLSALGAVSAFFGMRALMSWYRRRSDEQQTPYPYRAQPRMMETDIVETDIDITAVPEPDYPPVDMPANVPEPGMSEAGVIATGRMEVGENYPNPLPSQRDQASIPTTGMMDAPVVDQTRSQVRTWEANQDRLVETDQPMPVGSLVGPLIVHLYSFNNMIKLIKQRRETESAVADTNITTPDVRAGGVDAVKSLEAQLSEFDRTALVPGSLQERIFEVMDHIRDWLQNMNYSEDQLLTLSDKLRPEVCKILAMIHRAEQDTITGFEDMQKAYSCG